MAPNSDKSHLISTPSSLSSPTLPSNISTPILLASKLCSILTYPKRPDLDTSHNLLSDLTLR